MELKINVSAVPGFEYDEDDECYRADSEVTESIIGIVAQKIAASIESVVKKGVEEAVYARIASIVDPLVDVAAASTFRRTNNYGEPVGDPIPMREAILDVAKDWWSTKVSSRNGSVYSHRNSSGTAMARGEYLCQKAAEELCEKTVTGLLKDTKESLKDRISESIAKSLSDLKR